ncbi:MAG: hypothetical protein IPG33_00155 [Betaproteobacteria bacterium]|nr:hypothetical protein [Betaproteobacteria bacterium]
MEIVPDLAANLPRIQADTVMLEQILLNLMRNGMEAMRATEAVQRHLVVSTALAENSLLVSVADHGSGISPEAIEHLFEPFSTTKPEGMGMGLNICRSIIGIPQRTHVGRRQSRRVERSSASPSRWRT